MTETTIENTEVKPSEEAVKQEIAYITFVLDESSSMSSGRLETIDGVNQQIAVLRKDFPVDGKVKAIVSFVKFASSVSPVFLNKSLNELVDINQDTYSPNGMTAMYDGVGFAIDELSKREDIDSPTTSVLLVVVSDGQENNSRTYDSKKIAAKVSELQKTGRWTITYLGANQDLAEVRKETNFSVGNTQQWDNSSSANIRYAYSNASASLSNYSMARSSKGIMATDCFFSGEADVTPKEESHGTDGSVGFGGSSVTGSTSSSVDKTVDINVINKGGKK